MGPLLCSIQQLPLISVISWRDPLGSSSQNHNQQSAARMSSWKHLPSLEQAHFPGTAVWSGDTSCHRPSEPSLSLPDCGWKGSPILQVSAGSSCCLDSGSMDAFQSLPEGPHGHSDQCLVTTVLQVGVFRNTQSSTNKVYYYPYSILKTSHLHCTLISLRSSLTELPT